MTDEELDALISEALATGEAPSAYNADDTRTCVDNDGNPRQVPFRSPLNGLGNEYRWTPAMDEDGNP